MLGISAWEILILIITALLLGAGRYIGGGIRSGYTVAVVIGVLVSFSGFFRPVRSVWGTGGIAVWVSPFGAFCALSEGAFAPFRSQKIIGRFTKYFARTGCIFRPIWI